MSRMAQLRADYLANVRGEVEQLPFPASRKLGLMRLREAGLIDDGETEWLIAEMGLKHA